MSFANPFDKAPGRLPTAKQLWWKRNAQALAKNNPGLHLGGLNELLISRSRHGFHKQEQLRHALQTRLELRPLLGLHGKRV